MDKNGIIVVLSIIAGSALVACYVLARKADRWRFECERLALEMYALMRRPVKKWTDAEEAFHRN